MEIMHFYSNFPEFVPNGQIHNNPMSVHIIVLHLKKSLAKPIMAYFIDASMLHSASKN